MNPTTFIQAIVNTSAKNDKLPELAKHLAYFAKTHDILHNMPRALIVEGDPQKLIDCIVKNAKAANLLEELCEFIKYFSGYQRLMALTGGDTNVLRIIDELLAESLKTLSLLTAANKPGEPLLPGTPEEIQHRLNLIGKHANLNSPENIEAGVYASFGGKEVCLSDKKMHMEATAWIKFIQETFLTLRNIRDASRN
jgi:hypothetical protein